jgi:hypothetical protein
VTFQEGIKRLLAIPGDCNPLSVMELSASYLRKVRMSPHTGSDRMELDLTLLKASELLEQAVTTLQRYHIILRDGWKE